MLTSNIKFKNFKIVKKKYKRNFFKEKWFKQIKLLESLKYNYRYSYSKKNIEKYKKKNKFYPSWNGRINLRSRSYISIFKI